MADAGRQEDSLAEGLRKRTVKSESLYDKATVKTSEDDSSLRQTKSPSVTQSSKIESGTYWLTRILLLRYLGFIYFVAFLVAQHQNKQLIGSYGILPASSFLDDVRRRTGGREGTIKWSTFLQVPSLLWLFDYGEVLDELLDYIAYAGLGLSTFLIINGGANWFIMFALWALYHSLVNVGQRWYGFGWESQLLETGFLAIFLCPLFDTSSLPRFTPTSKFVIWGYRWLIFRIMLGAGLIKIRGDKCWRDLTCMNYHYETQPVPNPMAYYMHQSPEWFHMFETLSNHFVELIAPLLLLMPAPRICKMIGGSIQILFQVVLIISGNLSFLNWLTILPSLACFDDASITWMFSKSVKKDVSEIQKEEKLGQGRKLAVGNYIRRIFNVSLAVLLAYLSMPVVQNLMSSKQHMNSSFDPFRLVNTYGAFGSVTKERTEVIFQGTHGNPDDSKAKWLEYEFKCKPGKITRRPCLISPYHYRLDWLLWFAAFQNYHYNPWIATLTAKLLQNDNDTMTLIDYNPFQHTKPPKFIRLQHYSYKYTKIGSKDAQQGRWWKRRLIGNYMPAVSSHTIKGILSSLRLDVPKKKKTKKIKK
ncbi:lipase maturation factor 1-like [Ruditapes philippinarum]|uniref:lipase maturation factor 1-like n=1 Tax=Ruditapes philippinarum TaxID=129788 RepID=UPI00295A95AD|nr:lipase maturation factor 1-like [Ruditapes philippinarum]